VTAVEYREYTLLCDQEGCLVQYGPGYGPVTRARLRKMAAKRGWTHVRTVHGREHGKDYCRAHKPEEQA
jgi:hypothetical protein